MPSEIGMIAEKYVILAPSRYSGMAGPGTFMIVHPASGSRGEPSDDPASSLADSASVAAGACLSNSVSSFARTAWSMSACVDVCL